MKEGTNIEGSVETVETASKINEDVLHLYYFKILNFQIN